MDSGRLNVGLAAVLLAMLWVGASAQSSSSCTSALINLSPCLNYITGNDTTPSSSCCSQLRSVISSEPQCLCMVLNGGGSSLGITINQTQALALPGALIAINLLLNHRQWRQPKRFPDHSIFRLTVSSQCSCRWWIKDYSNRRSGLVRREFASHTVIRSVFCSAHRDLSFNAFLQFLSHCYSLQRIELCFHL